MLSIPLKEMTRPGSLLNSSIRIAPISKNPYEAPGDLCVGVACRLCGSQSPDLLVAFLGNDTCVCAECADKSLALLSDYNQADT